MHVQYSSPMHCFLWYRVEDLEFSFHFITSVLTQQEAGDHCSRWELANMEEYMQMGLEMGIDAIISRPSRVQQLRNILSDLGVCSEFLNKSPQAKSRCWQSPLILVRYQ